MEGKYFGEKRVQVEDMRREGVESFERRRSTE
jgi:hypothetical protein